MKRFAALLVLSLAACASSNPAPVEVAAAPVAAPAPPPPAYELTKDEKALDCRKLTGRMKVRIAAMRNTPIKPSAVASVAQSASTTVFGGTKRSADPEADRRADRARLDAYNKRLVELKCPAVDIDKELQAVPTAKSVPAAKPAAPKPTAPAAPKPAAG